MKVLIETLNNRKGYKFFENREDFSQYADRRIGRPAMPECEVLENKLFYIFRQQNLKDNLY